MTFSIVDHIDEILQAANAAAIRGLTEVGQQAQKAATYLCPVGTVESTGKRGYRGGTLKRSITYQVHKDPDTPSVIVGSNVEYAPYVELGTGPYFDPPPDWEKFATKMGSGKGHGYVKPRKFLQPAILDHLNEYREIITDELRNA